MHGQRGSSVIALFLGDDAARGGPVALLGLPPTGFSDLDIIAARDRCMRRIELHQQGQSPAADEVRLALHAAAAQLLNPAVRQHLHQSANDCARSTAIQALEQDVILTLAMYGGWTRKCLPRLLALTHSRGLQAAELAQTLRRFSTRKIASKSQGHAKPVEEHVAAAYPVDSTGPAFAIFIGLAAVLVIGALVTLAVVSSGNLGVSPPASEKTALEKLTDNPAPGPSRTHPEPSSGAGARVAEVEQIEADEILKTLLGAIAHADEDRDRANADAVAAVDALATHWLELPNPVRTRALDAVVELMYRLGGPTGDARELLRAVGRGALVLREPMQAFDGERVPRAVWSIGALTRLRRERDLSAQTYALIDRWLGQTLGATRPAQVSFSGGALAALQVILQPLLEQPEKTTQAWRAWAQSASEVTLSDEQQRLNLLSKAAQLLLEQRVTQGERSKNYQAIAAVMRAVPWRGNTDTKQWFSRQFDNRNVSTPALSAATRVLVSETDAENIDPTMVLSATASDLERRDLRDQYILAWGLETPGSNLEVLDSLSKAAKAVDDESLRRTDSNDALRIAVEYAWLNASCAAQWQGNVAAAATIVDASAVKSEPTKDTTTGQAFAVAGDGQWAEQYLLANINLEQKAKLLEQLRTSRQRRIGPVDAEVLVDQALRGSGNRIREIARQTVDLYATSPAVVNALLEEAPRIAPTADMTNLIISVTATPLPDRNSPNWKQSVRRALVERLLELLAADSLAAGVDRLAYQLDDAYDTRAAGPSPGTDSSDRIVPPAIRSARALFAQWRRVAERTIPTNAVPLTLADIEKQRAGRKALASGIIQEFSVEQLALAQTMAFVIASEQPAKGLQIGKILEELDAQRRQATHIFEQVEACERAMLRLWEIRLGVDGL